MHRLLIAIAILATLAGALFLWRELDTARPRSSLPPADPVSKSNAAKPVMPTPAVKIPEASQDSTPSAPETTTTSLDLQQRQEEPPAQKLPVTTPAQLIGVPLKARDDMVEVVLVNEAQEPILEPWTLFVAGHA